MSHVGALVAVHRLLGEQLAVDPKQLAGALGRMCSASFASG